MVVKKKKIGLIVGSGELANYCMEQLILLGYELIVVRLPCSKIKIIENIDYINAKYEEIDKTFDILKEKNIHDIALIGYVERPEINIAKVSLGSQKILMNVFSMLTKGDGEIFVAVRNMFIEQNFKLVKVQDFLPELTLSSGSYGTIPIDKQVLDEIEGGLKLFLKYAKLDIGQSLILQGGHCLGIETITGTDEMIKALINYKKKNAKQSQKNYSEGILIKGSKPDQILHIDTPVIGPNTIKLAKKAQLKGLVIESHKVILLNKDLLLDMLRDYNMFLVATRFLN
jgi:hypothetical protein